MCRTRATSCTRRCINRSGQRRTCATSPLTAVSSSASGTRVSRPQNPVRARARRRRAPLRFCAPRAGTRAGSPPLAALRQSATHPPRTAPDRTHTRPPRPLTRPFAPPRAATSRRCSRSLCHMAVGTAQMAPTVQRSTRTLVYRSTVSWRSRCSGSRCRHGSCCGVDGGRGSRRWCGWRAPQRRARTSRPATCSVESGAPATQDSPPTATQPRDMTARILYPPDAAQRSMRTQDSSIAVPQEHHELRRVAGLSRDSNICVSCMHACHPVCCAGGGCTLGTGMRWWR